MSTAELLDRGMKCLQKDLGVEETEEFIMLIKRDKFDYTKWRQKLFEGMTLEELNAAAAQYEAVHPFVGNAKRL